ncbi:crossover junction endonuclease EME1 [Cololabis saira]|uniref:crossover junction endonuclease EME1 n=1 Tax=Cololabis saira TaxID=129043 RepID=UPI002AD40814|nr:crossover junction endonuclease EME1 [Cololabis saira]
MDSCSDLDEELPVFDFLQPCPRFSQAPQRSPQRPELVGLKDWDAEHAANSSPGRAKAAGAAAVMMISSDSDDDTPYVPLAQRLKLNGTSASSTGPRGKSAEQDLPSDRADFSHSGRPLSFHQVKAVHTEGLEDWPHRPLRPLPDNAPAKKKATKRTTEDIQASREEALRKRREKEALRQEQDRHRAERKALAETAKALRPEECIKHMVVAVDPALLQTEGGGTLLASLQALGCSCAIEKQVVPQSVGWSRRSPCGQLDEGRRDPEPCVVLQMTVEHFITLIHGYIQEERLGRTDCGPTLTSWVQEQQRRQPSKTLSLAVIELEKYFRLQKSRSQKRLREAVAVEGKGSGKGKKRRKNDDAETLPEVSRVDVEEAAVHLQLHTGVSLHFLSTWKDFSDYITMTTKAVAEAPFKREREQTGFSFYLESEWAGGQRVDRAGGGLLQVWKRQIQQFNRVSPDMAAAIVAAYPSPQLLEKAYGRCRTEGEKMSLLSDLLIRRGEGVTSTTRRVGPELSKRIYLTMHSWDPEQNLMTAAFIGYI